MGFFKNTSGFSQDSQSVSKVGWTQLTDLDQLDEIVEESMNSTVLIFKHSTRCGVSKMVLKQFENEFTMHKEITPYFLDILAQRTLSNEIATRFSVVHQSPQLIVIKEGKAVFNESHGSIDASQLAQFI